MNVEIRPGAEFQALARKIRGAPAAIRKEMNQAVKTATAPAERDLKAAVMALDSKGVYGGGSGQRSRHSASRSKTGKSPLPKNTGLRKNIAKGITRKITYSGYRIGVRVRADGKYLPYSQQVLIKRTNDGKPFRHPVMGNTDAWVTQQFTPARWFDDTMRKHQARIQKEIAAAATRALSQLQ